LTAILTLLGSNPLDSHPPFPKRKTPAVDGRPDAYGGEAGIDVRIRSLLSLRSSPSRH